MAGIRIDSLRKAFGQLEILKGIDLDIADGEFVCFLGPSGCGKSTLLRSIAGLENLDGGEIRLGGRDITDLPSAKRDIAMVFQSYALYPHMNVRRNLSFGLALNGMKRDEIDRRVSNAAEILRITELLDRKPRQLSGGQRQRVAIGRAIIREPKLFLLDEPLSNLDAGLRVTMRVELAALHERLGVTMIYVTHDQVEAMTLADRVVVLDKGRVSQFGTPLELFYRPANLFVAGFIGSPRMNFLTATVADEGATGVTLAGGGLARAVTVDTASSVPIGRNHPVTLGIRPDKLELVSPEAAHLVGTVRLVERLGTESHVHIGLEGGGDLTAVVRGTHPVASRERVHLRLSSEHCHLFDAEGCAIERQLDRETQALIDHEKAKGAHAQVLEERHA
ncbi:sn-glycerol-3-phosphate ABC transporter ATP-binding protein UgpC [Sinorhizobium medicae]|uniref:ABC transporter ATP-binding protein n=1 Tax=Sinorhizobium medicae TaxID=110321 RepID=UPI000FD9809B|nr:sn-glycerol-3-phosphate ABC transporter ATP-binding protein UgpC [Sinorhizobium medicae]MDX0635762.1 sn-glycerol-3-phosphate ABC transporter ATP-binding protein UgpC [Sinorhizobium medicae]RVI94280.1 sn-glycerol-3-phosphate ABC transporter ATP-binding protein UgpC [Sinorhizobium medicae]